MFPKKIFAIRIKGLRQANGLTLAQLGQLFGVSKQSAQRWETGVNVPSAENLVDMADYLSGSIVVEVIPPLAHLWRFLGPPSSFLILLPCLIPCYNVC